MPLVIILLIVYKSYSLRIQNMLYDSQYLKMLLMFTSNLLSHYMVIAFCRIFKIYIYCVICNVGILISKLFFVECFIYFFIYRHSLIIILLKTFVEWVYYIFKFQKLNLVYWSYGFIFLIMKIFILTQFASNFFSIGF